MGERDLGPIDSGELDINSSIENKQELPQVTRDSIGRIRWRLGGNTDEENLQLGIRNVQGLFLEKFPGFLELFPFDVEGQIIGEKRDEAREFMLNKISSKVDFLTTFPNACLKSKNCPYFGSSYFTVLDVSFSPWGIKIIAESRGKRGGLQVPRYPNDRYNWLTLEKESLETLMLSIEGEARSIMSMDTDLSHTSLNEAGLSGFYFGVQKYYPGGFNRLRENLGLPAGRRESGYWNETENIKGEAEKFVLQGGILTHDELAENGQASLAAAISTHYPGSYNGLRKDLEIAFQRRSTYWTLERVEQEAEKCMDEEGNLTEELLGGSGPLLSAVQRYPGGLYALKERLGASLGRKPAGYWTPERVEQEASKFLQEFGGISQKLLSLNGRGDLVGAIGAHYDGGMQHLKQTLGVRLRPLRYWGVELIEERAMQFLAEEGDITFSLLNQSGQDRLGYAIYRNYPGGIEGLRAKLGLEARFRKPHNYWTIDRIEEEARNFFQGEGKISSGLLTSKGLEKLATVIKKKYPGGMRALRNKLVWDRENISPEKADEFLGQLLEDL